MNIDPHQLMDELLKQPKETEWLEFKLNNADPQEIGEYISALANSACLHDRPNGYLIFGIEDKNYALKGTNFRPKDTKCGNEELENWLARCLEPRIDFKVIEIVYRGCQLVIFVIDCTQSQPVSFKDIPYVRIGTYKKKLRDFPEKERKIWMKASRHTFERQIALSGLSADDVLKLLDYPNYFQLLKLNLPSNKQGIIDKFQAESLIEKESTSNYRILNLGGILFAKNLNDFPTLKRKAIRVIFYKNNDRIETISEKNGTKGYVVGFEHLIAFITDRLPQNEIIGQAFRKEIKMFPEIAIREIVANALIHQDFNETGTGPMIEIFQNRIEITNPGKPLISTLRFIDHNPQSRNEVLASFLRRAAICEERGSGIDKVIKSIEAFQLPAPNFMEGDNYLRTILYAHKPLNKMDRDDKLRACYQHCCLRYVMGEHATNSSLRERFKVEEKNYSIVSRIIGDAIKEELIKPYDPENQAKKYAKYVPFWA